MRFLERVNWVIKEVVNLAAISFMRSSRRFKRRLMRVQSLILSTLSLKCIFRKSGVFFEMSIMSGSKFSMNCSTSNWRQPEFILSSLRMETNDHCCTLRRHATIMHSTLWDGLKSNIKIKDDTVSSRRKMTKLPKSLIGRNRGYLQIKIKIRWWQSYS